ncbi:pre-mRNA-splicing factor CLF1 [Striga asiatica]|uniref:Pre-mRNA-splicing factor CLF1 n=1 Tax=Striga asiatica TaxID=4170 RepID=A0A5A7PBJ2_STRAF|nr:pre-mRNA-splicing factor CLF1 [Striga asiatica]
MKFPRPTSVKNKTPATIQITADQILRERQEAEVRPPKQKITDTAEIGNTSSASARSYEDLIQRMLWNMRERRADFQAVVGVDSLSEELAFVHKFRAEILKKYFEIELQLGNIERCRKFHEKCLEWSLENCYAWSMYAELERYHWKKLKEPELFLSLQLINLH